MLHEGSSKSEDGDLRCSRNRTIVAGCSRGILYHELATGISEQRSQTPVNTGHGSTWDLASRFPTKLTKPRRRSIRFVLSSVVLAPPPVQHLNTRSNEQFDRLASQAQYIVGGMATAYQQGKACGSK